MPLVQVKVLEGVFSDAQKREMIRKLTDAMVSIEGEPLREVTWVVVEEVGSGNWGMGGRAVTTGDVKAMGALPHSRCSGVVVRHIASPRDPVSKNVPGASRCFRSSCWAFPKGAASFAPVSMCRSSPSTR